MSLEVSGLHSGAKECLEQPENGWSIDPYMETSLIRTRHPLGPYSRLKPWTLR